MEKERMNKPDFKKRLPEGKGSVLSLVDSGHNTTATTQLRWSVTQAYYIKLINIYLWHKMGS